MTIDYQTLSLRERSVLLPSDVELVAVEWNGREHFNSVGFSSCHVFEADLKLSDSSETLVQALDKYESTREVLPGGLEITIKLDREISGPMKVGEVVTARTVKAVRSSSKLLVPQDAIVKGRIREFRQVPNISHLEVGVELYEVDTPGHVSTFFADVVGLGQIAGVEATLYREG